MTIEADVIHTDDFNRANGAIGANYPVIIGGGSPVFSIDGNRVHLTAGGATWHAALIDPALIGSPNQHVEMLIDWLISGGARYTGAFLRCTQNSATAMTGYALTVANNIAQIFRVVNGTGTELGSLYVDSMEGDPKYMRFGVDTVAGDVLLTVDHKATEGGTYAQVFAVTDTSGSKILTQGSAGLAVFGEYDPAEYGIWDELRILGTAVGGGGTATIDTAAASAVEATTATLGCNSDIDTGTLRVVLATSDVFTGVTGAQIKAGQNAAGSATGVSAFNAAFSSDTTPTVTITGRTRDALYYGAMVVETGTDVFSNVLPFTLQMAEPVVSITDIVGPNSASNVADATDVNYCVFSAFPGATPTVVAHGTLNIAAADAVVPCGNATLGATVEILLGWTVGADAYRAGGPFTVVNGNA